MWLRFSIGALACAVSFAVDIFRSNSDIRQDIRDFRSFILKEMRKDERIVDALTRTRAPNRFWHDRKNLTIEVFRYLFKTHELKHSDSWVASFVVKAIWFNVLLPWLIVFALTIVLLR